MKTEQLTLSNGLNTLLITSPFSTVTTAQIWFKAGSSLEKKENQGIAHFLEHMFFKGSKKYPGAKIAKTVESYGGEINAFTSFDYTCYYINGPAENTKTTVDVLMDMVSNPLFLEKDLIPEREVVFEEYRRSIDNSSQYNFFKIQNNSFTSGYKHPILGTEKNIKNFTVKQLHEFRNKYYNQENAMLVVAGGIKDRDKLIKQIESFDLPSGDRAKFPTFKLKNKDSHQVHSKEVNQTTISITIEAPNYSSEEGAIEDLALNCLGFGDNSPLHKGLVHDTSLASAIGCSSMFFNNGGCHFIRMSAPAENLELVLKEFTKTLQKVFIESFTQNDIDRIRNQYVASKIYEKESIESYAFSLGHGFAQTGDIHCENEFIAKMKKVKKEQILHSLSKILNRNLHISVQTPKDVKVDNTILDSFIADIKNATKSSTKASSQLKYISSTFDPEVKVFELKKGIKLIYRHNPLAPTFVSHAYIKGGLTDETAENNGVFNLIGKNLTYGHKGCKYEDLKNELDLKSSYLSGFSGRNAYGLTFQGLSEFTDSLLNHFGKILTEPTMPSTYFKLEKELIKRTLHIQKEEPVKKCFREFSNRVFNQHPYHMDIVGSESSIKKLNRKLVLDMHQKYLSSNEIVLTYCGDGDEHYILDIYKNIVKDLKPRSVKKLKVKKIKAITNCHESFEFDREQTHIMIGKPSYKAGSKEDFYLKMLTTYLSGQSSELFVEVRDRKGLCYSVQPIQNTSLEGGYWGIYIGTGHDKKDAALKSIKDIIQKYQKRGFSQKEFMTIKKMIKGQNQLSLQTNDDYAHFYSVPVLHSLGVDYQHSSMEDIDKFKRDDVNNFLSKFLKDDWITIDVGRAN